MEALASGLRGQAQLAQRVKEILYGDSVSIRVEVDREFEIGSFVVPVHILVEGVKAGRTLLAGETITAIANLMQLLGFFGISGGTLYALFKKLKGRRIEKPQDVPKDIRINIEIDLLIRIYNDPDVQAHLRKTLDPLHQDGIDEFQTRRNGQTIESVKKSDLQAADEAEVEDHTRDEEVVLDIEKAAWRRDLAWHFNDGHGSFDAKISDPVFWKNIENGEAFSVGDSLRVHLQTTARRTRNGHLKIQRHIPRVLKVDHIRMRQGDLFETDQGREREGENG